MTEQAPAKRAAGVSTRDRLYLRAWGKLILCERRRPAEERELRRRRYADGSYPVPRQLDPTIDAPPPALNPFTARTA